MTLDIILGVEDILISWFVIILALLGVASLFVCCMIHGKAVSICVCQMQINSLTYLLTYLLTYRPLAGIEVVFTYLEFQTEICF